MAVSSGAVKATAKAALRKNYLKVVAVCSILLCVVFFCNNTATLLSLPFGSLGAVALKSVLNVFLVVPIALGVLKFIWRMIYSAEDSPIYVFHFFSSATLYLKALKIIFQFVFRTVLWLMIFNVPSVLLLILSKSYVFDALNISMPIWAANLEFYSVFARNISYVAVFFMMLKYYMAPIIFVADEDVNVHEAMYNSTAISKRTTFDFLGLILSLVLWILPSVLILPLPFTMPVILTSYCVHVRFSVTEFNRHIEGSRLQSLEFS